MQKNWLSIEGLYTLLCHKQSLPVVAAMQSETFTLPLSQFLSSLGVSQISLNELMLYCCAMCCWEKKC